MKPGNLSVRFILEGESCSDEFSDSEQSKGISDSEDEWKSCVSSVEEDECFYDMVNLEIPRMHLITLFPPGHCAQILRQI